VLGAFVTLLREAFEASLLVAIVLAYLAKIGHREGFRAVWGGVGVAIGLSLAVAGVLFATASELEGASEKIFEGSAMLVAVAVLTYMVLWMRRESRTISSTLREGVDAAVRKGSSLALGLLVFTMVLREGIETGLFVFGITQTSTPLQVAIGSVAGLGAAVALGYAVYAGGRRINLSAFFRYTGGFLILVAAGLLAQAARAFEEAGTIPAILYPLWDLTGAPVVGMGTFFTTVFGSVFGWDPKPDLLEFLVWAVYLLGVGYAFLRPHREKSAAPRAAEAGE